MKFVPEIYFVRILNPLPLLPISSTNAPSMYFIGLCLSYCCWFGAENRSNGTADFIRVFTVPKESAATKSTRLRRGWIRLRVSNNLLIINLNNSDISRKKYIDRCVFERHSRITMYVIYRSLILIVG